MLRPPIAPMLAKLVREIPRGDYFYEPKWDGFRAIAFSDGTTVEIRSRAEKRLERYFPEVVEAVLALGRPVVLDGELVVARESGFDFEALMARLHPAASRVAKLRVESPVQMIVFDALAIADRDLRAVTFAERRAALEALFAESRPGIALTPSTDDAETASQWLASVKPGIDGVVAKARTLRYEPGRRAMIKVKTERTSDCVVAGVRLFEGPLVAALLLGLYDPNDRLVHVGVASQLAEAKRRELARELLPDVVRLAGHPWEKGFGLERSPLGRLRGAAGRWTPDMVPDWVPLAPKRVVEVAYGIVDGHRFRHPARLVRFRPDRDARSCRIDQLEPR